jgi:sarcosine oxidase/L-pipecolate oxidase
LDRHPKFDNIVIGVGFSGNSFVKFPVVLKWQSTAVFGARTQGTVASTLVHLLLLPGSGFKISPVVGKILFQLAFGLQPSYDMEPFKISRFQKSSMKSSL